MKIGILQCDNVSDELQEEFGNYPEMFEKLLGAAASDFEFQTYRVIDGELPKSMDECDAYITTGSRHSVNDEDPWVVALEKFVVDLDQAKKKFVGICYGHQMLAKALGGEVAVSDRGWGVGISCNEVDVIKSWMDPEEKSLNLVISHSEQVSRLPAGVEVLAGSDFCPNYMLQVGDHMMSVQGHPEFSKSYSRALMDKRADRIPADCIRDGRASLAGDSQGEMMMRWIANFIKE